MFESNVPNYKFRRGKVRDIYEIGQDMLLIVSTDRISAHDCVMPTIVPDRGKLLTQLSLFWAEKLEAYYHLVSDNNPMLWPEPFRTEEFIGRTMMVEKCEVIPFECVVRGYLCGSAWEEYKRDGRLVGHSLPAGLKQNMALPRPLFTPATKEETGHDINVTFEHMAESIGLPTASEVEEKSLELYQQAAEYCWTRGLILCDTKFEWGRHVTSGELILIDEVLTSDSSRYWPVEEYALGTSIPSYDKQPLRDWLNTCGWDKKGPPPVLPEELVNDLARRYQELFDLLTAHSN